MKQIIAILICMASAFVYAQDTKPAFDAPSWKPPYALQMSGWGIERFLIPIEFAPQIKYSGVEDLRFTKGWGDSTSAEYWSYAFLWFLDGKPAMDPAIIEQNLNAYYDGLVGRNIEQRKIPASKVFASRAAIKKTNSSTGDAATFIGTVDMLDYMRQQPIQFNCVVHLGYCPGNDHSFLFYEISPQATTKPVWQKLNDLWKSFDCKPAASN